MKKTSKKEFLDRSRFEIQNRVGMDLTKDQIWAIFCVLLCTMYQITIDRGKFTLYNLISLVVSKTKVSDDLMTVRIKAPLSIRFHKNETPNIYPMFLRSNEFNIVMTDYSQENTMDSELS